MTRPERRANRELREVLDDLLDYVRHITRNVKEMNPQEVQFAEERLEWLAEEVWRAALGRPSEEPR